MDAARRPHAVGALLAACAGALDAVAFFGVGQAFAGIVTGNIVTAGFAAAAGLPAAAVWTPATAVGGTIAGEAAAAAALRRGTPPVALLGGELVLLVAVSVAWVLSGGWPLGAIGLVMIAAMSAALGIQGVWALHAHQTTTYFTGLLTTAVDTATAGDRSGSRTAVRQLGALLVGAVLGGIALGTVRTAATVVPLLLLTAAVLLVAGPGRRRTGG